MRQRDEAGNYPKTHREHPVLPDEHSLRSNARVDHTFVRAIEAYMNLKLTGSALLAVILLATSVSVAQQGGAIGEPLVLQTTTLPKAFLRQPYHFKLEAQGGILPLRWEVTNGSLPEGMDLAPDGTMTGAPTEVDTFHFVVTVTD